MYLVSSTSNDVIIKCFLTLYLPPLTFPPMMKQKINRLKLILEIQLPLGLIWQKKVFEINTLEHWGRVFFSLKLFITKFKNICECFFLIWALSYSKGCLIAEPSNTQLDFKCMTMKNTRDNKSKMWNGQKPFLIIGPELNYFYWSKFNIGGPD